ncbi:MAG: MnmC family methyltransferase [Planctomycetota bacterium]
MRDPRGEARQVFVQPAARVRLPRPGKALRVLEIGFGRGLNTAAALEWLQQQGWPGEVEALGLEPFPERCRPWPGLPAGLAAAFPWWGRIPGPWRHPLHPGWRGEVRAVAAPRGLEREDRRFDWIFLDLFSPGRHPGDWAPGLFASLARVAAPGAVLTTYSCARRVREGLAETGWRVERLKPAGRRDTLRARWSPVPPSSNAT